MAQLRFVQPSDDVTVEHWRHVHNTVIPTAVLSADDVRERLTRNHLEVAYAGDLLVGNSTVWPPSETTPAARVIARVLPEHRRQGFGEVIYERAVARAHELGATTLGTVVLSSNEDGLRFALRHGFVERDRYLLPGDTIPWIDLERPPSADDPGEHA